MTTFNAQAGFQPDADSIARRLNALESGTGISLTGPLLFPNGTATAPSISFASSPNTGFSNIGGGAISMSASGAELARLSNASTVGFVVVAGYPIGWGSVLNAPDLTLFRDAANTLAQRNGVNAQTFNLYNTYTDASNYERAVFDWTTNVNALTIGTKSAGTGVARSVFLTSVNQIYFAVGSSVRWVFNPNGSNGDLAPNVDNAVDFGSSASRVRNLYVASGVMTGAPTTYTGATYAALATDTDIIANAAAASTITLLAPASYTGRTIRIKTIAAFAVNSASANVVPLAGGAAGTAILAGTVGKWADLKSDGTNWITMAGN